MADVVFRNDRRNLRSRRMTESDPFETLSWYSAQQMLKRLASARGFVL